MLLYHLLIPATLQDAAPASGRDMWGWAPSGPPDLLQQTRTSMQAALSSFVDEARVAYEEQQGHEPPSHVLSGLDNGIRQLCGTVEGDVLCLHDTLLVWDRVFERVIKPALAMALGASAASEGVRPCHDLYEAIKQLTAGVMPPGLLRAQFDLLHGRIPGFWDRLQSQHLMHAQQEAQRQSTQALLTLAAASSSRGGSGFGGPGPRPGLTPNFADGGQLSVALRVADEEYQGKPVPERGCKFWSGIDGSCRRAAACPDAMSHVAGQPSPWYLARSRVWAMHGGVKNNLGNWSMPRLTGVKRPPSGSNEAGGAVGFQPQMG